MKVLFILSFNHYKMKVLIKISFIPSKKNESFNKNILERMHSGRIHPSGGPSKKKNLNNQIEKENMK